MSISFEILFFKFSTVQSAQLINTILLIASLIYMNIYLCPEKDQTVKKKKKKSIMKVLYLHLLTCISCILSATAVSVVNWQDIVNRKSDLDLSQPLKIVESPMKNWAIFGELAKRYEQYFVQRFTVRGNEHIQVQHIACNCSCISQVLEGKKDEISEESEYKSKCEEYCSQFLYVDQKNDRIPFWTSMVSEATRGMQQYATIRRECIREHKDEWISPYGFVHDILWTQSADKRQEKRQEDKYYLSAVLSKDAKFHSIVRDMDMTPYLEQFGIDVWRDDMQMYLWMGSEKATAIRHYDFNHNLYLVLFGCKTFHLSAPHTAKFFTMYPFLHPSKRHQILAEIFHTTLYTIGKKKKKPNYYILVYYNILIYNNLPKHWTEESLSLKRVRVCSGEALFLPSFWFHHVVNEDAKTFAVNMWWVSPVERQIYEIQNTVWKLSTAVRDKEWGERFVGVVYFVRMLLHNHCKQVGINDDAAAANRQLQSRCLLSVQEPTIMLSTPYTIVYAPLLNEKWDDMSDSQFLYALDLKIPSWKYFWENDLFFCHNTTTKLFLHCSFVDSAFNRISWLCDYGKLGLHLFFNNSRNSVLMTLECVKPL
ncbi:hypothetical protein RFI_23813 [Reticulomyxa filosa]|uniref:JmjC domain-containing protein n=1 Tax=Reticulomyxa filosa TaxID=46433 RepID=X6MKF6_RETFI|nr:hypothetical protein RFI_23813 [Reticulomyxa filosa]|eukprot:ETO13555.1 hypothetical protein RFI_23813 [Reticulomyxa filosa]